MKKYVLPAVLLAIFETIAVSLWLTKDNLFYLFNFSYIGISIALGVSLYIRKYRYARRVTQLLVGCYMLVYLGPLLFGRGWCGYACWTAMVLDFLPYKQQKQPRKKLGWIRYITFVLSFVFVLALFLAHAGDMERIMFWAFLIGNLLYYIVGIALAFYFQDNRAFCKYICPVTVFLKPMSYDSLLRIKCDKSKCISCGKCKRVCPMDVDITDNSRKREIGTSCILFCTYSGITLSAGIGADCRKNRSLSRAMDSAYRDF